MGHDTNFLDLYKILGLAPDCELAEFKQAYRRRVGVLHPDRRANSHSDVTAAQELQQLTTLYSAAIAFQRQHGRLPGAPRARAVDPDVNTSRRSAITMPARTSPYRLLLLLGFCVAGLLLWNSGPDSDLPLGDSLAPTATATASETVSRPQAAVQNINIGTDADVVRRLQGAPILISGNRWDYGPSWIRFENHKVVGWYNSPVRPLKTVSTEP